MDTISTSTRRRTRSDTWCCDLGTRFWWEAGVREDMPPQIEFDDEDPAVWELFVEELSKRGLEPRMEGYKTPSAYRR